MIENLINNLSLYIQGSAILAFAAAYLGGLVISFTPCTYPLIPVTVGFIGAQGAGSKLRGFLLSLFYVLGLAVTYAALGAVAALSGRLFGPAGTGLGLAVVQKIMDTHGGVVQIESKAGIGTTVTLRFPMTAKERMEK